MLINDDCADIKLLHDIVNLAEAILPTLPEQQRLPTNALFRAAEQVLPAHGYDAELTPSHISRFIFKLGGARSGRSLYDRFETILAGMGIKLEFVDSGSVDQSPSSKALSPRSSHAGSPRSPNVIRLPRRRQESLSEPPADQSSVLGTPDHDLDHRVMAKPAPSRPSPPGSSPPGAAVLHRSFGDSRGVVPYLRSLQDAQDHIPKYRPALRPRTPRGHALQDETDEDTTPDIVPSPSLGETEDTTHELPAALAPLARNIMEKWNAHEKAFLAKDIPAGHAPGATGKFGLGPSLLDIERPRHSPPTEAGSNIFPGASDTTVQTEDDQYVVSAGVSPAVPARSNDWHLDALAREFQQHHDVEPLAMVLDDWHEITLENRADQRDEVEFADRVDNLESTGAAFFGWADKTALARSKRLGAEKATDEEYNAWIAKSERLASRAHAIQAMFHAVDHWAEKARDEADRTAVARRHVLRKRLFCSWSQQHNEDELKVKTFALNEVVGHWAGIALSEQVRNTVADRRCDEDDRKAAVAIMWEQFKNQLADYLDSYRSREEVVSKWHAMTQEADLNRDVASFCEVKMPLIDAINTWHQETQAICGLALGANDADPTTESAESHDEDLETHLAELQLLDDIAREESRRENSEVPGDVPQTVTDAFDEKDVPIRHPLGEEAQHWDLKTRAQEFSNYCDQEDLRHWMHHWVLEERRWWYAEETRRDDMRQAVSMMTQVHQELRGARRKEESHGDMVVAYYRQADTVESWLDKLENMAVQKKNAQLIDLVRTAGPYVKTWANVSQEEAPLRAAQAKAASIDHDVTSLQELTSTWRIATRDRIKQKLTGIYHEQRRKEKRWQATRAVNIWRASQSHEKENRVWADQMRETGQRRKLRDVLGEWKSLVGNAQTLREGAELADQEVHVYEWADRARETRENGLDAVDYDAEQSLGQAVGTWEHAALELDGPKHTVTKVQEKSDQRSLRDALSAWYEQAVPEAQRVEAHRRSAIAVRRSLRQSVRESSRLSTIQFEDLDDEPLNLDDVLASTPTRRHSTMAPYRTTTTPSSILPSPYERQLRSEYGQRHVIFADITEVSEE